MSNSLNMDFSYHFNLGLINSIYRNGLSYTGQDGLLNNDKIFSNYQFKFVNGSD